MEVGRHEHPRLWQLLKDVSTQTASRAIDKVVLCPDAGIGVLLSGNLLKTMFGRGKRTLVAGIPSLHNLTVEQLRAILAHEYGHFSHRDTQWGSFTYVMGNSLLATLRSTPGPSRDGSEEGGWIRLVMSVNPAFWMLWVFVQLYFKVTQGFSRVREVLSDMRAIKLCGGRVFAESLMKVSTNDFVFSQIVEGKEVPALLKEGKGVSDLSEALESVFAGMNAEELNAIQSQLLQRNAEQEAFASHPTLKVRCDYSLRFPDAPSRSSEASVQGLFVDWAQLNQRIAALYNFRLAHLLEAWQKVASGAAAT
jgi:Zn-dependent protease with chaperone function